MDKNANRPEWETVFSSDFTEARSKFLHAARMANAKQLEGFNHPLNGPEGELLACDVALFGSRTAKNMIITISGLHGVEGWAGAACQLAWCRDHQSVTLPDDVAILHIHAINPWGMAWDRRQQEDNIDLNRHFVDFNNLPDNSEYAAYVDAVMCPDTDQAARKAANEKLADFLKQAGRKHYGMVLQGGQYQYPEAPSFGGTEPSWSYHCLKQILQTYCKKAERIVVCDFHTGYGPYGYGIPLWHLEGGAQLDKAKYLFGPSLEAPLGSEGAEDEFIQHGHLYGHIIAQLPDRDVIPMCFEFGGATLRAGQRALLERADALMWRDRNPLEPESREARKIWREIHVPDRSDWREMVWSRGRQVLRELTERITEIV